MNFDLKPLLDQLRVFWEGLEPKRRVALVASVVASVVLVVGTGLWASSASTYTIVRGGPEDVQRAAAALFASQVPYSFEDEGTSVVVLETDVGAARVALASDGIQAGLDIIDALPVGSTSRQLDIAEKAQMERDLSLTLSQLRPVKSAAVHLVLPEDNSFLVSDRRPATASIVMAMAAGSTLSQLQLKGVVNLVASAVPELRPESINVINQNGELLWDGDMAAGGAHNSGDEMTQKRRLIEDDLEQKIIKNLRSILPDPSSFSVSVRAELSHTSVAGERKELLEGIALEERIEESKSYDGRDNQAAGADANTGSPDGGGTGGLSETSKILTSTTPGHMITRSDTDRGELQRVSVAVTVDSRKVDEIAAAMAGEDGEADPEAVRKQLHALALSSAGATGELDSVEVIMLPFAEADPSISTGALVSVSLLPYLPYVLALVALVLGFGMVVRPVMKLVMVKPEPELSEDELAEAEEADKQEDDLAARLREMVDNYESVDREDLNRLAEREAEAAAQVIRLWSRAD